MIKERDYPSQHDLDLFLSGIEGKASLEVDWDKFPILATSRKVIEHYVRGADLVNFDKVKFFVYHGVKVYEEGKRPLKLVDGVQP